MKPHIAHASRREFLAGLAGLGAATVLTPSVMAAEAAPKRPLIVFSKAFQELNYEDTADLVAEIGWDGIECPLRRGGQILPERVDEDLPRMVEALKKRGKAIYIATTDIREATPQAEKVLRACAKHRIHLYRMAYWRYEPKRSIPEQLNEIKPRLKDLVAMNKELGVCAGYQNHSGPGGYVGAPVWDLHELFKDLPAEQIGVFFDIGHATVEGGYAWQTHARLLEPRFKSVYVKDFAWQKAGNGWTSKWCPLGQGMISREFFRQLSQSAFAGPIAHHLEFPLGAGPELRQNLKADFATLKQWMGRA